MTAKHTALELVTETARDLLPAAVLDDLNEARAFAQQARSAATVDAHESDAAVFAAYCAERGVPSFPVSPALLAAYVAHRANTGAALATIRRAVSTISALHTRAGIESPARHVEVQAVLDGVARELGVAQKQKAAATADVVVRMVSTLDTTTARGLRDRAMLLLGFAGGFRRSELVALTVEDLSWQPTGLVVQLRRSKTDQLGAGRPIGVPYTHTATCPARALRAWLDAAGITSGALFRSIDRHGNMSAEAVSDKQVARLVKTCAEAAGLDAAQFGGHSLRAGLVTSAVLASKTAEQISMTTGHSHAMIQRYVRAASALSSANVLHGIGL